MSHAFIAVAAAACMLASSGAWADDADRYKVFNDFLESRTARIVEATGGTFKAGKINDDVEIAGKPPIVVSIDCGSSDDTISTTILADVQYPSNR